VGLLVLLLAIVASPPVRADEIVVPPLAGNSGSCWPFGCGTQIQTVFDAALFPSAVKIDALTFFNTTVQSAEGGAEPANYRFSLSTTPKSSATVGTNMGANLGADNRLVAQWNISDWTFFTTLTLPLDAAYVYSPFVGNLLLNVEKNQTVNAGDGPIYANVNTNAPGVATVINDLGNGSPSLQRNVAVNVGISGQFFGPAFNPGTPSPTPEPASLLLIGSGLAALVVRRRQSNS
jgi:hypothetical protein